MTKWVSANTDTPVCYHTDKDCDQAGDNLRRMTEGDARRNIRECAYCSELAVPVLEGE